MPTTSPDLIAYPDSSWSSGIVAALAAMASSIQTALSTRPTVKHAEYTWTRNTVTNATLTAFNATPTVVSGNSVTSPTSYFTPTTTGFTGVNAGIYHVSVSANLPAVATGRTFIELAGPTGAPYRDGTQSDDKMTITWSLYLTAGQAVAINLFQTTGGSQNLTGRLHIDYFGPK
jgi:hypothetical protein